MEGRHFGIAVSDEGIAVFSELTEKGREHVDSGKTKGSGFWTRWSDEDTFDNIILKIKELLED